MEPWLEQFQKTRQEVRLTPRSKAAMRARLLSHIAAGQPAALPWWGILLRPAPLLVGSFAILVFVGGTLSAAAEQTVPGDPLYPVKVKFNESIRSALAITPQAKADWAVQRAARRLDEANVLAERDGAVASTTKHELAQDFSAQAADANAAIKAIEKDDPKTALGLADNFEKVLRRPRRRTAFGWTAASSTPSSTIPGNPSSSSDGGVIAPAPNVWSVMTASETEQVPLRSGRHLRTLTPRWNGLIAPPTNPSFENASGTSSTDEQVNGPAPTEGSGVTAGVPDNEENEFDMAIQNTLNDVRETRQRLWNTGSWQNDGPSR
ncbi:MAG TPA: DUF5667 domain-containing protein [Candidatus Paceibacterota bacterium]|nr:DUF5667 domain-containing protein [Candidatus Paceibacterota bacterium]